MVYCQKVNYTADWGFLLTNIVRVNPGGALEFAQKLASAEVREPTPSLAPCCPCAATLAPRCPCAALPLRRTVRTVFHAVATSWRGRA